MAICVLVFALYWPGAHGGLYFDDSHVLSENEQIRINQLNLGQLKEAANSFLARGREISMLSFGLNHYFFGSGILSFKVVNICLHLLTGILIFVFTAKALPLISGSVRQETLGEQQVLFISLFATSLWMLAPINLSAVLYVSQRMTVLAHLFITLGLVLHLTIRSGISNVAIRFSLLVINTLLFTWLAYHSKENGILLPAFVLMLEVLLLRNLASDGHSIRNMFYTRICIFLVAISVIVFMLWPTIEARLDYGGRDFTLEERLLTQLRALSFYLSQILVPSNRELSMWHDGFALSRSLLDPPATLISGLVLFGLVSLALVCWKNRPIITFAIFWFFLSHSLESTIFPLELVHEHRNYYASFGVALLISYLLIETERLSGKAKLLLVAGFLIGNSAVLHARSQIWSNDIVKAAHESKHHPDSSYAQFAYARFIFLEAINGSEEAERAAITVLERNLELDDLTIANEVLLVILASKSGFEPKSAWIDSMVQKVEQKGYTAITSQAIAGLVEYLQDDPSGISISYLQSLFDALASSNDPRLITYSAIFESEIAENYSLAMDYFRLASELSPANATFKTNFLRALIKTRQFDEACITLEDIDTMDAQKKRFLDSQLEQARKWLGDKC